ncbi:MAG TPA: IS4 family transposase [Thermomicrobiales bacterium]|nr:IS4 family transposase [Thermomicrobiales bacterium]
MGGGNWAIEELGQADLGDARRTRRLARVVAALAARPGASVPEACGSWAATKAAYRLWASPHVAPAAIRRAHAARTVARLAGQATVLAIQDTTDLDFTHHPATAGLGPLGHPAQQGLKVHSTLAASVDGVPLGLLHQQVWRRDPARRGQRRRRRQRATAEKESQRWLTAWRAAQAAVPAATAVVTIADREADIYDFFAQPRRPGGEFLIRAAQDRCVQRGGEAGRLWATLRRAPAGGTLEVAVPRGDDRPARRATLTLRWASLALRPPRNRPKREGLAPVAVRAVLAEEAAPPPGATPVRWLLLTTLPVATRADAARCVRWYTYRWLIERYHFALKSGCRVEALQLHTAAGLERALATYGVVAWRLLWLTYQARRAPDAPCDGVLAPHEWQALWCTLQRTPAPPAQPPSLRDAVRGIARLGGFLGRAADGEPGVQVVWRGLRRLDDIAATWALLHGPPSASSPATNVGKA